MGFNEEVKIDLENATKTRTGIAPLPDIPNSLKQPPAEKDRTAVVLPNPKPTNPSSPTS